jgi:hypothetical protein
LKENVQDLTEGVTLSKILAFLCFHMFQAAVAKASKKKGFPKLLLAAEII